MNDEFCVLIPISLKFVSRQYVNNGLGYTISQTGDKPLSEPMMTPFTIESMRHHVNDLEHFIEWASCLIRKLRVTHAPGMSGMFSPPPRVSYPDMHHSTCAMHVPWCMTGSLTSGFLWRRWRGKRSRHSRRMRNPQFYISGKKPIMEPLMLVANKCLFMLSFHLIPSNDKYLLTHMSYSLMSQRWNKTNGLTSSIVTNNNILNCSKCPSYWYAYPY